MTGASQRNWANGGADVVLLPGYPRVAHLLPDPERPVASRLRAGARPRSSNRSGRRDPPPADRSAQGRRAQGRKPSP